MISNSRDGGNEKLNMKKQSGDIVSIERFVNAARDAGYRNISAALAELIDNAFQARARTVRIVFERSSDGDVNVITSDNGTGMKPAVLREALQFGGSTRFNSRTGLGRFGMGLPNSSLSHAKRVDVLSWTSKNRVFRTYLDVDEVVSGKLKSVSAVLRASSTHAKTKSGTVIVWSKCDRIVYGNEEAFLATVRQSLGRIFRKYIQSGKRIFVGSELVPAVDPLFLDTVYSKSAECFGPKLNYEIALPISSGKTSTVTVQFVRLPVEKWHRLSNEQKRKMGISKGAGISIVRCGREIDYGWFFMGLKRKENYDDWWRCEICFDPDLDEMFGVTNTKQGIRPTKNLVNILTPDLEQIAHKLNGKVRTNFAHLRAASRRSNGEKTAARRDHLLEPPPKPSAGGDRLVHFKLNSIPNRMPNGNTNVGGLSYRFEAQKIGDPSFFIPIITGNEIVLLLNKNHPFYECIYAPTVRLSSVETKLIRQFVELMLLSAGRAECSVSPSDGHSLIKRMREEWGRVLATFLE
jgi:hypothetical protein